MNSYFFGKPSKPRPPSATGPRRALVVGAYPSAVHAAWLPPSGRQVRALPVADEPVPFWDGEDAHEQLSGVLREFPPKWGRLLPVYRNLNGSSGIWVRDNVLKAMALREEDVCITDCLDTYRLSTGAAARLTDTYQPLAEQLGLPPVHLPPHPGEDDIVQEALGQHRQRLLGVLADTRPEVVVTLGNAALRVMGQLLESPVALPRKLAADDRYGTELPVLVAGRHAVLLPLAHPAAPKLYQLAHRCWMDTRR